MQREDEEKKTIHLDCGTFYYRKMSFGLKNVATTYRCLVENVFRNQIGRNVKVYVYDMVIKSHDEVEFLHDIKKAFQTLTKAQMKLNHGKCTFGVDEDKFLGYQITNDRISPN